LLILISKHFHIFLIFYVSRSSAFTNENVFWYSFNWTSASTNL
jgi:hypothetical protein